VSYRSVLHIDIDCFAASAERLRHPQLHGKPLIISHVAGGRQMVACASYEARRGGAHPGMPLRLATRRVPKATVLQHDAAYYEPLSRAALEFFRAKAPVVEAAGNDAFYLDITGCDKLFGGDLLRWSHGLAARFRREIGLPVSMGLATNKLVARLATWLAKPGHVIRVCAGGEADFLAELPVRLLPGVGDVTRERLRDFGVDRVGQLADLGDDTLELLFGAQGAEMCRHARGEDDEPVKPTALHRVIQHTHVFTRETDAPLELQAATVHLAQQLAYSLRQHRVRCARATLKLTYTDGVVESHGLDLLVPTDLDQFLVPAAREALAKLLQRRVRVRQLTLTAPFRSEGDGQFDLFQEQGRRSMASLVRATDAVRERFGFEKLIAVGAVAS